MSFNSNAVDFATYKHTGVGFHVSYPSHWKRNPNGQSEIDFATSDYTPMEDGEFVMLLEAGKVAKGELELISISLQKNISGTAFEAVVEASEILLMSNEVHPDSVSIISEVKLLESKGVQFQKLKYLGIDTLIGCFKVDDHIVTIQIMLANDNPELEISILESVAYDL